MKKKTIVTALLALLLSAGIFGVGSNRGEAADEYMYEVLTRANMRKEPSVEGQWVMTVPNGAFVSKIGTETNGYSLVEYLGTKGYVYSNCLKRSGEQTEVEISVVASAQTNSTAAHEAAATRTATVSNANTAGTMFSRVSYSLAVSRSVSNVSIKPVEIRLSVTNNVNFRSGASSSSKRLSLVPRGSEVIYLDDGENGFYHVRYEGQEGYIYGRCMDLSTLDSQKAAAVSRTSTSTSSESTRRTAADAQRMTMGTSLLAVGRVHTVDTQKVTTTATEAMAQEAAKPQQAPVVQINHPAAVTPEISYQIGVMTSMRSTPDESDNLMATLPMGADVMVLGTQGGYTMVQYDGMVGYVLGEHVVDSVDYAKLNGQAVLFTCTAYCTCQKCCGQFSPEVTGREAHTATGTIPTQGRTIAVDPSVIPYGSHVSIEGMGTYIAEDCGGGVKRDHIDIYFDNHEDAVAFGTKRLYVTIEPN